MRKCNFLTARFDLKLIEKTYFWCYC